MPRNDYYSYMSSFSEKPEERDVVPTQPQPVQNNQFGLEPPVDLSVPQTDPFTGGFAPVPNIFAPAIPPSSTTPIITSQPVPSVRPESPQSQAQPTPQTPMKSYTTPGGGTVAMPSDVGDAVQNRIQQQNKRAEYEAAGLPTTREAQQAQKIAEAKAGIGARMIQKSLEKQGISATREEVAKAVGADAATMTKEEAFRGLNRIQKREQNKRVTDRKEQRVNDRLTQRSKRNEDGTPANDAAVMEDFVNDFATPVGEGENEKPLSDYMTPSQKRNFDRVKDKASRTSLSKDDIGRMNRAKEEAMMKAEKVQKRTEYKKASEDRKMKIEKAQTDAQNAEQKKAVDKVMRENSLLEKEYKRLELPPKKETDAQKEKRTKRMSEINSRLDEISKSFEAGSAQKDQTEKTPAQWVSEVKADNPGWTPQQVAEEARKRAGV